MSPEPTRWICTESKTPLVDLAGAGARCSWRHHFHVRLPHGGFAGAVPRPAVRYADLQPEPAPALAAGAGAEAEA